jgi:hypothetical protein
MLDREPIDAGNLDADGDEFAPIDDTQNPDEGRENEDATPPASGEPQFFDPKLVPPELQDRYKQMQRAFTRRMQTTQGYEQAAQTVQRFYKDPEFARQVLQERAQQLGLTIGTGGQEPSRTTGTPPNQDAVPAELIESIRAELPPEMQWMAEAQAKAFWKANRAALAPVLQRFATDDAEKRRSAETQMQEDMSAAEAEMDEAYPLWREDEQSLADVLKFLANPRSLRHPKYGNKLALVYQALQSSNIGAANTATRTRRAGQNRTTTGRVLSSSASNLEERIQKAPNREAAFRLAAEAAIEG